MLLTNLYGINILEDLLFWTDNRNQPRKINTVTAAANPAHYSNEDHISVAKYSPYKPIELFKEYSGTFKTTMKDATSVNLPDGSYRSAATIAFASSKPY